MSPRKLRKSGPSSNELRLRAELDRLRRENGKLKALAGVGAGGPETVVAGGSESTIAAIAALAAASTVAPAGDPESRIAELERTRERLSKLYFEQLDTNRKRTKELRAILKAVAEIYADLDLDTLVDRIAATIKSSLGFRMVLVRLREPGTDRLRGAASAGLGEAARAALDAEDIQVGDFESWLRDEFKVGQSYLIHHRHPFHRVLPAGYVPDLGRREDWEWHPEDVLLVPLRNLAGELVGYLSVDDPEDRLMPSRHAIERLETFGAHAAIAIENARAHRRLAGRTRELEQAGAMAHEMNTLKSTFVQTISHELRTPLTAIQAYVDTLLAVRGEVEPGRLERFLGVINDETRRLSRLIESVLDLSRFDAGHLPVVRQPVHMGEVLEETVRLLHPMGEVGEVNLKVVNALADTHVEADRDQMRQLVLHLGSNAIKFTPPGGSVVFRLEGDEREVSLHVEDTGIGIPSEALDKVFDRFYQVDSSLVRRYGGTGLGLAICKSIIEWHGGRLFASSTPGQGSSFTAQLPRRGTARVIARTGHGPQSATEDLLKLAIEMVSEVMNAGVVSMMVRQANGDLVIQAAIGLDPHVVRETRVAPGVGVSGWVMENRRPVCVSRADERAVVRGSGRPHYTSGTFLSVPLEGDRGPIGVLNVTGPAPDRAFEAEDCRLLLDLAQRVAYAWEQAVAVEAGRLGVEDSAEALRALIQHLRLGRTSAPDRVRLAQAVAHEMRLTDDAVAVIGFAAAVHDVGMTLVGQDILNRDGRYTDEERAQMRRHVELGADLLKRLETMAAVREVVLCHHEWWDGTGYPRGLAGADIPVGARVLAVVDAFESMTRGRRHRPPFARDAALLELARLQGRQFDPEVVEALERIRPRMDSLTRAFVPAVAEAPAPHARR